MNPTAPLLLGCLTEKENIRLTDHAGLLCGLHTTADGLLEGLTADTDGVKNSAQNLGASWLALRVPSYCSQPCVANMR